jgi:hypothetical protein
MQNKDYVTYANAVRLFLDAGLSETTFRRKVHEFPIYHRLPEGRTRGTLYLKKDVNAAIEQSRKEAPRRKRGRLIEEEEEEAQTDWIQFADEPYAYVLDCELYGVENAISPSITWSWWEKNPYACRIIYNAKNRKDIWGLLSILPMEEETIIRLLRGEMEEKQIRPEHVLSYEPGHHYTCYVAAASIRPDKRPYFGQLLHSVMEYWCDHPHIHLSKLYAFALDGEEGDGIRLIRKLFFSPRYDIGENTWELRLDRYNPSPTIQRFQECLRQKRLQHDAPLRGPISSVLSEPSTSAKAQSVVADADYRLATREDIPQLAPIDQAIFGPAPVPMQRYVAMHQRWYERNHEVFHVLKSNGQVIGYVSTLPLPLVKIMQILKDEAGPRDILPEEIDCFEPGKPLHVYVAVMGIDNGFSKHQKRLLAGKLINGLTETFRVWGQQGVIIQEIYARSRFEEGIVILEHVGFQEMASLSPVNGKRLFCLDLTTATGPFAKVYTNVVNPVRD